MIKEVTFNENGGFNLRDYTDALYKAMELLTALLGSAVKEKDGLQVSDAVLRDFDHHKGTIKEGVFVKKPEDALPLISHIANKKQEYFVVISLSADNEVIACRVVTIGLLNKSQIHAREVFADAISDRAFRIIIAHNHPAGTLTPTSDDIVTTRKLVLAGEIIGIAVEDHIIVSKRGFLSLGREGLM